ncbi:hypothetical protein VE04_03772 [Pseudogymnoascus sp. 24MN13]|nr:hypothetical protein VE04_03772 [Pseudogymnoascus sp. 24MN13]
MAARVDGSEATASTQHPLRQTTFLIPNLHCPSCVSHIEDSLSSLQPKPSSISHSIVAHSVTVYHDPCLLISTISDALEGAGYEVYSVIADPSSTDTPPSEYATNPENRSTQSQWFERATQRWKTMGRDVHEDGGKKRKRHIEHCDMCRAEEKADAKETVFSPSTEDEKAPQGTVDWRMRNERHDTDASTEEHQKSDPFVVVESHLSPAKIFQASISITGMTCSSCVGKIAQALEEKHWIHSVDVSLLNNSASVRFDGEEHLKELVDIIDSVGYEATVEEVDEIVSLEQTGSRVMSDVWQASYAIGGMSCSSCVGNLTQALEGHPWIRTVDVNLIANSATVVFEGKDHLRDIQVAIEDVGYEAKLDDVLDLSRGKVQDMRRTVAIRIDGMYCERCPSRIQDALRVFDQRVTVEKPSTIDVPILKIAYIPHAPDFTIRHVLAAISTVDAAFEPSIFHPPTLEERSRKMYARQRRRFLLASGSPSRSPFQHSSSASFS